MPTIKKMRNTGKGKLVATRNNAPLYCSSVFLDPFPFNKALLQ